MTLSVTSRGGREVTILATALAAVLLSGCASTGTTSPPPAPAREAPHSPEPGPVSGTEREVADPARVRIPSIGVSARIVPLAIDSSGTLAAPEEYDVAGWNRAGPEPGERGTAVIAGHVDSRTGPAVFFRLRELRPGDRVEVERADGGTARFTVTRIARHSKNGIPDSVYRPASRPEIRLVTCGGTFDRVRRSYRDNIIVHATAN